MNTLLAQFAQFHFLRPFWLCAMLPALLLAILLWQRKGSAANWRTAIAPELIGYLLESAQQLRPQWPWLLLVGWLLATFALAGPTWEKLPQPVLQKRDGVVIVLDLSLSMYAEDIKPSRLQRARFKVIDILKQRREGLTGLVVYSGDAHVVSPLTDDTATIENLVPSLSPAIMPDYGSDAAAGIDTALQLLRNSGFERGRIILLSDEIAEDLIDKITAQIDGKHWQLSIIGVGTEQGAPITFPSEARQRGFMRQSDGSLAIAKLHRERFTQLAAKVDGRYDDIRVDDSDIERVLPPIATTDDSVRMLEREFDQWRERGPQFMLALLPLAALAFRRGWLLLLFLLPFSAPSQAWEWRDLWLRPDQQAQRDFNAGNSKAAAEEFQDPNWRGAAQYRSGDFAGAAQSLQSVDNAGAHYNRGNALAHEGNLQDAITAYDAALKQNPTDADAKANRELIEKLLKQQQKNNQSNSSPQNQQDQSQNSQQQNAQAQQDQSQSAQSQQSQSSQKQEQNNQAQNAGDKSSQQNSSPQDNSSRDNSPQKNADKPNQQNQTQQNQNSASTQQDGAANQDDRNKTDAARTLQDNKQESQQSRDANQQSAADKLTPEQQLQQRATEQWLRQIPDDPSGLLRRKFQYENQQRGQQQPNDGKPLW